MGVAWSRHSLLTEKAQAGLRHNHTILEALKALCAGTAARSLSLCTVRTNTDPFFHTDLNPSPQWPPCTAPALPPCAPAPGAKTGFKL